MANRPDERSGSRGAWRQLGFLLSMARKVICIHNKWASTQQLSRLAANLWRPVWRHRRVVVIADAVLCLTWQRTALKVANWHSTMFRHNWTWKMHSVELLLRLIKPLLRDDVFAREECLAWTRYRFFLKLWTRSTIRCVLIIQHWSFKYYM